MQHNLGRAKRIWYLSPMRAAKVQASLRIRAVSPEPSLLAHTSSESRRTFRQKARSLVPMNGWACAVKICHDGMLEDTNSLDGAHFSSILCKSISRIRIHFSSKRCWQQKWYKPRWSYWRPWGYVKKMSCIMIIHLYSLTVQQRHK